MGAAEVIKCAYGMRYVSDHDRFSRACSQVFRSICVSGTHDTLKHNACLSLSLHPV